jgi:hypothetical protein
MVKDTFSKKPTFKPSNLLWSIFYFSCSVFASMAYAAPLKNWIAFGEIRGHFEPCGCDVSTDLGGVIRLGSFVAKQRALAPDAAVFSLGNHLSVSRTDKISDALIMAAIKELNLTAALVNIIEATTPMASFPERSQIPWVLSNRHSEKVLPFASDFIRSATTQSLIFGYLSPTLTNAAGELIALNKAMLERWSKVEAPAGFSRIMLFSGTSQELKTLQASKAFDVIISANLHPLSPSEKLAAQRLPLEKLIYPGSRPSVLMVPVGGQGVLRGGELATKKPISIQDIFSKGSEDATPILKGPSTSEFSMSSEPITWLDRSWIHDSPLARIESQYNAEQRQVFLQFAEKKAKDKIVGTHYVGAAACKDCHKNAYEVWQSSRHAKAIDTLLSRDKHEDLNCTGCHVVGFESEAAGGYIDQTRTPHLANVQCESCHGPRSEHIKDPSNKPKVVASEACIQCHKDEHSPNFRFSEYWPKIQHGF